MMEMIPEEEEKSQSWCVWCLSFLGTASVGVEG